jgi:transposase
MSGKRYTDEFKIEAVKQITDRGYNWTKKYGDSRAQYQTITGQQDELRRVKAQL